MTIEQTISGAGYTPTRIAVSKTGLATVYVPTDKRVNQVTLNKAFAATPFRVIGFGYHCELGHYFWLEARPA